MAEKNCVLKFKKLCEKVNAKNRGLYVNKCPLSPLNFGPERDESEWKKLST
jgi:hypothetical protein